MARRKNQQTLEEHWAGVPGMPDLLTQLDAYERDLQNRQPAPDTADADERQKRLAVIPYLRAALATLDPVLASPNFVQQLQGAVTSAVSALNGYGFQPSGPEQAIVDLTRSLIAADAKAPVARILDAGAELQERAATLSDKLASAESLLMALEAGRKEFEETVNERVDETQDRIDEEIEKLVTKADSRLRTKFESIEGDRTAAVKAFEDADQQADAILAEMRERLSIASDTALSHDYSRAADQETKTADRMRLLAVIFGVITGLVALAGICLQIYLGTQGSGALGWSVIPGKLAVIATFGAIARWLGRESGRHRAEGQKLRRTQLQLRNLGSFLAELDPADRNEARKQLLPRFFNDEPAPVVLDGPSHIGTLGVVRDAANGE